MTLKSKFPWATNPYKLEKAVELVGDKDEDKLKVEYQRLGGLMNNSPAVAYKPAKPAYAWAANKSKLDRAILRAKVAFNTDGKPEVTEESIKDQYLTLGGLVLQNETSSVAPKAKKIKADDED